MMRLLLLSLGFSLSAFAQGGHTTGNGGDAILIQGTFENLSAYFRLNDFYLANIVDGSEALAKNYHQLNERSDLATLSAVKDSRRILADLPLSGEVVAGMIGSFARLDPLSYFSLFAPAALYRWNNLERVQFVDDFHSRDDHVNEPSTLTGQAFWRLQGGIYQVGRRFLDFIEIAGSVFSRMPAFDQVGLIVHESFYALMKLEPTLPYGQDPDLVRDTVASWFKNELSDTPSLSVRETLLNRFGMKSALDQARAQWVPGERLKISFERGKFFRIQGEKFVLEFKFVNYQTPLFLTKALQATTVLRPSALGK